MNNILQLLKNENPNIRKAAILALTLKKDTNFSSQIIPLLKDQFWQIKIAALKFFQAVKTKDVLPILLKLIDSNKLQSRKIILNLLSNSKNNDPKSRVKKEIARTIALIDKDFIISPLVSSLKSNNDTMKIAALAALGDIEKEIPEEPIIELLDSENNVIKLAAVVALGKIKSKKSIKKLIELSNHKDKNIRKEVLIALNHIKAPKNYL